MNFRQLEVFWAVMRCQGITDAARMLEVSQPAVSKMLRQTETQLGMRLFQRVKGRLVPTREAEELFPEVDRIFQDIGGLRRFVKELRHGHSGILRVAATASLSASVAPRAVTLFQDANPGVKVLLTEVESSAIGEQLGKGQVDLALLFGPFTAASAGVEEMSSTDIVCVMTEKHPLASHDGIEPKDLSDVAMIGPGSDTAMGAQLDELFRKAGRKRRVDVEVSSAAIACALAAEGKGVALVDALVARAGLSRLAMRPLRPRVSLQVVAAYPSLRPLSAPARSFIDLLKGDMGQLAAA
ncbi:MAG: LysR family transcriptional regulator [Alphaproteobacteria bacterium]|nr:LysR family transcriptional regulator [Alphaproteobacteria bacterium]MBU0798766.1 LysR family transcriptional regulator [Alphaproteobacteria bacterium]MBU0886029.1 LysR family transcriptional regulator [Alphaproteobacteria bacterium]MBU1812018.1 LysR family transcriptional regulator [Alphaproteobacteria bacterium]MBU2090762.1 LysR family transcriptional regulator [Alphaproteobacteria bacterium]